MVLVKDYFLYPMKGSWSSAMPWRRIGAWKLTQFIRWRWLVSPIHFTCGYGTVFKRKKLMPGIESRSCRP